MRTYFNCEPQLQINTRYKIFMVFTLSNGKSFKALKHSRLNLETLLFGDLHPVVGMDEVRAHARCAWEGRRSGH